MCYSPFIEPHSRSASPNQELNFDQLNEVHDPPPASEAAEYDNLLSSEASNRCLSEDKTLKIDTKDRVMSDHFHHRKQDSISSDLRDLPSCRSDDASGSSVSLESVNSGGPSSPIEKLGPIDYSSYSASTMRAQQASTPLNSSSYFGSSLFDFGGFGSDDGIDFISATSSQNQTLSSGFDYEASTDPMSVTKTSEDSVQIDDSHDIMDGHNQAIGDIANQERINMPDPEHSKPSSPTGLMNFVVDDHSMDSTNEKLAAEFNYANGSLSLGFNTSGSQGPDGINCLSDMDPLNTIGLDPDYLNSKLNNNCGSLVIQPPHSEHLQLQQQQQHSHQRSHHRRLQQQLQQQQPQHQHQYHRHQRQYQLQLQPHQHQPNYEVQKRRGLAIGMPTLQPQDQQLPPEQLLAQQQPLVPTAVPLHTQLNPPLAHVRRFPDQQDNIFSSDHLLANHMRPVGNVGGRQRSSDQFRPFKAHNMFPSRRMFNGIEANEFFHTAVNAHRPGAIGSLPGEDTYQGSYGFHTRSKSKSKLPLTDLFTLMGLADNQAEGRRREDKVMRILREQGFDLGNKTFIRDTDEPERKRIMGAIIEQTKDWGYSEELLEIIVHRGVYARMQSNLRRQRRSDNRQKARGGSHRLPIQNSESRQNHN